MKRVKAACICQTLHFLLKDDLNHDAAAAMVQSEVAHYKAGLDRSGTKYKIVDEAVQSDGSVCLKIIKQYNQCDVGEYLN